MKVDKVLVVDDDPFMRDYITEAVKKLKIDVDTACDGAEALKKIKKDTFDLIFSDLKMPNSTGIDLLKQVKKESPSTLIVILTAHGTIDSAVEAMSLGAFHYLVKPINPSAIKTLIKKAEEHQSLVEENHYLRESAAPYGLQRGKELIAESSSMKKILEDIKKVSQSRSSVFISGESGTGKEVIAHMIHHSSTRADHPFIKVNCAAVPESLIESEFFGHEKGAFTGALNRRIGRFELADQGTLLLDEVSEIPSQLQAKLLRITQEMEFERVGGSKPIHVDTRLISTSNRDIDEMLASGIFREDLFYRLNVVPIKIPPLRERKEDILPLAAFFLDLYCRENHKKPPKLSAKAKKCLESYNWPGNVRELANVIERYVVMDFDEAVFTQAL